MKLVALFLIGLTTGCVTDVASYETPEEDDYPPPGSEAALTNNERTAFNYFVSKGLTATQSAGVIGNLMQESSVIPTAVEYGGGPGRGIAQWGVGGRWDTQSGDNVKAYAAARGLNRWALQTQLDFTWWELTNISSYGLASLKSATTITAAVTAFQDKFEKCGTCAKAKRITYAQQALANYGGSSGGGGTGGGTTPPAGDTSCYSATLAMDVPENTCVQARSDSQWYQCSAGEWVDRYSDPDPCVSVHPL